MAYLHCFPPWPVLCVLFLPADFRVISPWHPKVFDFAGSAPIHKSNLARDAMGEEDSIRVISHKNHKRKQDETRGNRGIPGGIPNFII